MQLQRVQTEMLERQKLDVVWKGRFDHAFQQYHAAANEYRTVLLTKHSGETLVHDARLERFRRAYSEAYMEYCRVLKIYTYLTSYGRLPEKYKEDRGAFQCAGR